MKDRFTAKIQFASNRVGKTTTFFLSLLLLFSICSISFGEDASPASSGSKGVLFSFNGFSTGSYDGGVGLKYYFTDPLAVRASVQFAYANQSIPANPPSGTTGTDGSVSGVRFGLSAAGEYHFLKNRVSPYFGLGLGIASSSTKYKSAEIGATAQTTIENASTGDTVSGNTFVGGTTFKVGLLGGIEFFILKELSLGAEYQLGFASTWRSDQVVTRPQAGTTTMLVTTTKLGNLTQFGLNAEGGLTLAWYF